MRLDSISKAPHRIVWGCSGRIVLGVVSPLVEQHEAAEEETDSERKVREEVEEPVAPGSGAPARMHRRYRGEDQSGHGPQKHPIAIRPPETRGMIHTLPQEEEASNRAECTQPAHQGFEFAIVVPNPSARRHRAEDGDGQGDADTDADALGKQGDCPADQKLGEQDARVPVPISQCRHVCGPP